MSLELAKMRFDVPVKFDPEKLHFEGVSPEIRDITRRYEFRTLESRLTELPVAGGETPAARTPGGECLRRSRRVILRTRGGLPARGRAGAGASPSP